ncbi:unnamed protein product [Orchesella dallaii]|uniref:phospholipase A2 n=1 Tax=Orchesella dallaii TaxID=48710 RepID=A0ABP1RXU7_9HEXA
MKILSCSFALVLLLFCCTCDAITNSDGEQSNTNQEGLLNYIAISFLPDGESEIHVRFGDAIVQEASFIKENEAGVRTGLMLRQFALGPYFQKSIYKVEERSGQEIKTLLECEIINDVDTTDQFRNNFQEELRCAGVNLPVPPNLVDFLNSQSGYSNVYGSELQKEMKLSDDVFNLNQSCPDEWRNVSVQVLREDEITGELRHSLNMIAHHRECKNFQWKMKQAAVHNKNDLREETSSNGFDDSDSNGHKDSNSRRFRREAARFGIMPGTLWCGDGSLANRYQEMGAHVGTDRCCRGHDGCPFVINGMTTNYGLFNYRMHTLSHCACDEKFKSCLKQTNTGPSNFVGKLFFNFMQTKCFVLKPEKHCARRTWFGRCLKFEYTKQALLRDPTPY